MKLIKLKPSLINIPLIRVTSILSEDKEELLKDFLAKQGVIAPIVVQEIEGKLWLIDGKHRVDELIATGDHPVEAAVIEGDMVDLLTRNLFLDHIRGEHQVTDMIRVLKELSEVHGLDSDEIGKRTGLKREYTEKILKISTASSSVLEALDKGTIGVGVAFELSRLPYVAIQDEIIAKQQIYRFPVKEIKQLVDDTLRELDIIKETPLPPPDTGQRPAIVYHCEGCKEVVEGRYLRPVMLCPSCFGRVFRLAQVQEAEEAKASQETASP